MKSKREPGPVSHAITYVISRVFTVILIIVSGFIASERYDALTNYEWATGTVVGATYHEPGFSRHRTRQDLIETEVEFTTPDGRKVRFESDLATTNPDELGESVSVLYDPKNPERAILVTVLEFWLKAPLIFLLSILLWKLGSASVPHMRKKD